MRVTSVSTAYRRQTTVLSILTINAMYAANTITIGCVVSKMNGRTTVESKRKRKTSQSDHQLITSKAAKRETQSSQFRLNRTCHDSELSSNAVCNLSFPVSFRSFLALRAKILGA